MFRVWIMITIVVSIGPIRCHDQDKAMISLLGLVLWLVLVSGMGRTGSGAIIIIVYMYFEVLER